MVRPSDPLWIHVKELNDDQSQCKYCGYRFAAGISISRIKSHLAGVEGRGIKVCTQVPAAVRQEAYQAIQEKPKSSHEVSNTVSTSSGKPNNEVVETGDAVSNSEEVPKPVPAVTDPFATKARKREADRLYREKKRESDRFHREKKQKLLETLEERNMILSQDNLKLREEIEKLHESLSQQQKVIGSEFLVNVSHESPGDVLQESDPVCQALEGNRDLICSQSAVDDVLMNEAGNIAREFVQAVGGGSSRDDPRHNAGETRRDALPTTTELVGQAFEGNKAASPKTTELVCQAFEENKKAIWSWLMDDDVPSIGIYGMGGVGKTRLVKHVYNQLCERADSTRHLYWITVSTNFSIDRLQNLIANRIGLDLSREDDKLLRADELSKHLKNERKWVLILDDLWNYFDPEKVGIPIQRKGCKLILTTRSLEICRRVGCKKKIKVEPLSEDEAWTLFMEKLGRDVALSPEVIQIQIAKSVARECAGLPLGIITMAGSMRGVDDLCEWRNAWKELKESKVREDDMEIEVFRVLRFSYTHLNNASLQQCFLCCTLFPEDHLIEREKLLDLLSVQGIVNGKDDYDKGHAMLNKLENVCLLESCVDGQGSKCVKIHNLIRHMAIRILQENSLFPLKPMHDKKNCQMLISQTEDLVRV